MRQPPGDSLMTPGSQRPFEKTSTQAFKGTVPQTLIWIHILLMKAQIVITNFLMIFTFFLTPRGKRTPGESDFL